MRIFSIVAIIITLLTIQEASAQKKVKLGFLGGFDIGNFSVSSGTTPNSVTGFTGGAIVESKENENLSFEFGFLYAEKGADSRSGSEYTIFKLHYIDIPFLVKFGLPNEHVSPHLTVGAEAGIKSGAEAEFRITNGSSTFRGTGDISNDIETLNFSIDFGGGIDIFLKDPTTLFLDLRYSLGISNIIKHSGDASIKTTDLQILAGLKFGL